MVESGAARLKSAVDGIPRSIENLNRRLAESKTAAEKAYFQEMIDQSRAFLEEMRNVPVELPNITFDDQLTIHDKAHDLHLSFRGRGHTAGDIVVFCPAKKVIASGDLLHSFFPNIGDGYPREWPGTLRSIQQLEFQKVIGGHGSVLESSARAGQMRAYLEELVEIVSRAKLDGVPLERLQQTVTPASLKTLQGGYGDYLADSVKKYDFRLYLDTPAEVMARGVRDNLTAVFRNFDRA
jgi:glyoxylase-like metal-dependent hydrolase (beta-lactamase superfamily II)